MIAFGCAQVGDVSDPRSIGMLDVELALQSIGRDNRWLAALVATSKRGAHGTKAVFPHQALHTFANEVLAGFGQIAMHVAANDSPGSARVIENAGAKAIATTSAGMTWALGYSDGEQLPVQELLAACRRICQMATVPVSVDIEHGYARDVQDTGGMVGALIQLGVVGISIEGGTEPDNR